MLSEDDKKKSAVMAAIRLGETDEDICSNFKILSGTLAAIKGEYESIKNQLIELKSVSEIADSLQCSEEFVEEVKRIIEVESKREKKEEKKGKAKHIDKSLKRTGEEQAAAVLVSDAGDISKEVATKRQDIGKFVMEEMGTVAMQYGYSDHKAFLKMVYEFWLNNYGTLQLKDQQILEFMEINEQLQTFLDQEILKLFIARSLDRVVVAALIGGGTLDPETIASYKKVLESIHPSELIKSGGMEVCAA